MSEIVNWQLLKEPVNWVSVAVIVALAGFGFALLTHGLNIGGKKHGS